MRRSRLDPDGEYNPEDDSEWCGWHDRPYWRSTGCADCANGLPRRVWTRRPKVSGVKQARDGSLVLTDRFGGRYGYDLEERVWYSHDSLQPLDPSQVPIECLEALERQLRATDPIKHTEIGPCECAACMVGRP